MLPKYYQILRVPYVQMKKKIYVFCYIQITETSQVVNQWFGRTVIYSDQRFAYEEAQYIIETKDDTIQKKFRWNFISSFSRNCCCNLKMDELAKILRKQEWLMEQLLLIK
jgi:ribonuclease R